MMLLFVTYTWSSNLSQVCRLPYSSNWPFFHPLVFVWSLGKFPLGKKVCNFPVWQFFEEIFQTYFLTPRHLPFNYEKWKYAMEKKIILIIGDQKSMINFNQFETTIWAKHNTQWQWSKILKMMNLVWMMQMWKSWRKILTM